LSRRFALLVNPASAGGKALEALPAVHTALDRLDAPHRTVTTRSTEHAAEEAAKASAQGETVAALSGDGLLRPLAGVLKGTATALAVIPCGRGNDLARVLGIPTDPTAAAELAVNGPEKLIDVANVDGTPYLGIASLGFDSEANRIANTAPARLGQLVYLYGALGALATWKHATFDIEVDGERRQFTGWSVGACNSKAYGGGMYAAPDAELDDGALDVVYCERTSKATFVGKVLLKIFKGEHVHEPSVHVMRGAEVHIDADRPFMVYADGDPVGELPMTFRALPAALQVLLPA
jgi:YegS/Rv2252/BmrU family lipid kinase